MAKFADLFADKNDLSGSSPDENSGEKRVNPEQFTLLFVDDEPGVLNALKRVFRQENYRILVASAAEEAIQILESHPVHLVISDYRMPGMTGTDLLRKVKSEWPETIRIMLTGHGDIQAIMGAVNEGAVYKFITKPWSSEDLRLTVSLALQQYLLVHENRKLKELTKKQQIKIKDYSHLFNEYRGILVKILLKKGMISHEQSERVLREKRSEEFIGDTLVRLGFSTESKIVEAIRESQNMDAVDLKEIRVSPAVARFFPQEFCEKNRLIPIRMEREQITIAMADPSDIIKIDNIAMWTGLQVAPVVARSSDILTQIGRVYGGNGDYDLMEAINNAVDIDPLEEIDVIIEEDECNVDIQELLNASGVPPIIRIVNAIILEALRYQASDIHIEAKTKCSIIRYRIDGMLQTKLKIPTHIHAPVISRIKILSKMDISERRKPQDGRISMKTGTRIVDIRVSSMPTLSGEKIVMRVLDKGAAHRQLAELGIHPKELEKLEVIIRKPQGMVISTGPTGSGKTTLLYSMLHEMLTPTKSIETIEDPVEYFLEDANQVYVKDRSGLTFSSVLRATMRQDPDIILVGEIRDHDTADVAFKAALTGHMVLTSLHTNNTVASITRLIDLGLKPYLIASALEGIIAQRLVRSICRYCKALEKPKDKILNLLKIPETVFREVSYGKGCDRCNHTGYLGRIGIFEIFLLNDEIHQMISNDYKESEVLNLAKAEGMKTLMEDGIEKVKQGLTTLEELLRVMGPPASNLSRCGQCEQDIEKKHLFCVYCGSGQNQICHSCKRPLEKKWMACPICGTRKNVKEC